VAPLVLVLAAGACGDGTGPFANLSATNNADDFLFVAQTFGRSVTTTLRYTWQHSAPVAQVIQGLGLGSPLGPISGTATLTIRDGAGTQLYTHDLKENLSDTTIAGVPGDWALELIFVSINGDIVFNVRKAPRDLTVSAVTTGPAASQDPDGYSVSLDGGAGQALAVNASLSFSNLSPASHTVALSGVAANCTVSGGNSRTLTVRGGIPETVTFAVACS
jgi:hypothetical protein